MSFATAIQNTPVQTYTTNGMVSQESTMNPLVDFFYSCGASRGKNIIPQFEKAYQYDPIFATKIALWLRDIRGGAGERQLFRDILIHLESNHPDMLDKVLSHVPIYGRWDDLLIFNTTEFKHKAYKFLGDALRDGNGLAAKWTPRKGPIAIEIRNFFGMTPKQYRKALVALTNVVEQKMCAQDWKSIDFGKLPSLASARYQNAFNRNTPDTYAAYKAALSAGTAKINANAVYPYDVIKSLKQGDAAVAIAQWDALPNFIGDANILPMVDVSGSMMCSVSGNKNLQCIDISVSLGLYCADKNKGAFKDVFLTFSEQTKLEVLKGDIKSKYDQIIRSDWGMSTNLESAFNAVLNVAVSQKVPKEHMPEYIVIFSDMNFNQASNWNLSSQQMIEDKFQTAGYTCPKIIYWNLHDAGHTPVSFNKEGVALVSGFSPAIMKAILSGKDFTPIGIMNSTIDVERYNVI